MTVAMVVGALALVVVALVLFTAWTARRVDAALPPLGRFVEVDGARIHYVDRGRGDTPLLLIHGLGGHVRHFTYALAERLADEYRVVIIDRPGSGHSTRGPGAGAGPWAQAKIVAAVIRALRLERPIIVGHSLGGAVALATAIEHPAQVAALVLIAPLTHAMEEPPSVLAALDIRSAVQRTLVAWTVATPLSMLRRRATLEGIFGPDAVPGDFATAGGGLLALRPRAFITSSVDMVAVPADMPALVERYAELGVPVGILYGRGDRLLDPRVHGEPMRSRVARLELEVCEGGHMLPLTDPARVASFIRRIAGSVSSTPTPRAPARADQDRPARV